MAVSRATRALLIAQGTYYLVTGLWPLASMGAFEAVTGPKTDKWLVKTVGVLVSVVGRSLLLAARADEMTPEARLLALGSAAGLAAIDVNYATRGRISRVYLLDAVAEAALIGLALASGRGKNRASDRGEIVPGRASLTACARSLSVPTE